MTLLSHLQNPTKNLTVIEENGLKLTMTFLGMTAQIDKAVDKKQISGHNYSRVVSLSHFCRL